MHSNKTEQVKRVRITGDEKYFKQVQYSHLHASRFRHVSAFKASSHEYIAKPANETIREGKGDTTESERGKQGFARALEGVGKNRETCQGYATEC